MKSLLPLIFLFGCVVDTTTPIDLAVDARYDASSDLTTLCSLKEGKYLILSKTNIPAPFETPNKMYILYKDNSITLTDNANNTLTGPLPINNDNYTLNMYSKYTLPNGCNYTRQLSLYGCNSNAILRQTLSNGTVDCTTMCTQDTCDNRTEVELRLLIE